MDERFWCPLCESVQAADGLHDCRRCDVRGDVCWTHMQPVSLCEWERNGEQ